VAAALLVEVGGVGAGGCPPPFSATEEGHSGVTSVRRPGSDAARAKFLTDHAPEAAVILTNEEKRRDRKTAKAE